MAQAWAATAGPACKPTLLMDLPEKSLPRRSTCRESGGAFSRGALLERTPHAADPRPQTGASLRRSVSHARPDFILRNSQSLLAVVPLQDCEIDRISVCVPTGDVQSTHPKNLESRDLGGVRWRELIVGAVPSPQVPRLTPSCDERQLTRDFVIWKT